MFHFPFAFLQCLRRLYEEKDKMHALNGLKYSFAIAAVCFRTAYSLNKTVYVWYALAWIFSVIAAVSGTYWDLVHDWGLLQRRSKNRWLRDKLLVPQKSVYFVAMVSYIVNQKLRICCFFLVVSKEKENIAGTECGAEACLDANCVELPSLVLAPQRVDCNCC